MVRSIAISLAVLVAATSSGCKGEQEKRAETTTEGDGGLSAPGQGIDPNITKAVAEASKGSAVGGGAADGEGPPETGVFAPGRADRELAPGAAPKLTLGGTGSGEKALLKPLLVSSAGRRQGTARVGIRTGPRSAMPNVEFVLSLEAPKKAEGEPTSGPLPISGKVTAARLATEQPGRLPEGLEAQVKKLTGSKLTYVLHEPGGAAALALDAASGVDPSLARELASVADALPAVHGPFPAEPVGAGAFWMVTSREPFMGLDTVAYRMMRLEQLDAESAVIDVSTKRYVAGGALDLPGVPPHVIERFQGQGNGKIQVSVRDGAIQSQFADALLTVLAAKEDPSQRMNLQLEIDVDLAFPPESR